MVQRSHFIIGQVRCDKKKWFVLSHTFTSDRATNPGLLTWGFSLCHHLHVLSLSQAWESWCWASHSEYEVPGPSSGSCPLGSGLVPVTFVADHSVSRAWLSIHSGHGIYGTWHHGLWRGSPLWTCFGGWYKMSLAGKLLMVVVVLLYFAHHSRVLHSLGANAKKCDTGIN